MWREWIIKDTRVSFLGMQGALLFFIPALFVAHTGSVICEALHNDIPLHLVIIAIRVRIFPWAIPWVPGYILWWR